MYINDLNEYPWTSSKILKELIGFKGVVIFSIDVMKKFHQLNSKKFVLKAQIHAGGRGKAGKTDWRKDELCLRKKWWENLITHQTGPEGKK